MRLSTDIHSFVSSFQTVPSSQRVLLQLIQILDDPDTEVRDIANVIKLDPGLATSLMRLANSAFFGMASTANTVEEAVSRLGSAEIFKLVAVIALSDMQKERMAAYPLSADEMWRLSLASAIVMETFARRLHMNHNLAYGLGLMHGVGKWMISECVEAYGPDDMVAPRSDYLSYAVWEQHNVGANHAEVGALMLERWGFPEELVQPIRYQFNPFEAPGNVRMASLLRATLAIAPAVAMPEENAPERVKLPPLILKVTRLKEEDLKAIVPETEAALMKAEELLGNLQAAA